MHLTSDELQITGSESECSYLPGQQSRMHYRLAMSLSPRRYEGLLERGWRRFGRTLFRPTCRRCSECRSIRIDLRNFQPTKSQRRLQRRMRQFDLSIVRPQLTQQHIDLYNLYHEDMHERRGWPFRETTPEDYYDSFVDGDFPFSREFQYRLDGELVAIGMVDVTDRLMSSIYFIYDPAIRKYSPGTLSALFEIETGRNSGQDFLHLGYFIRDCDSMNYKNRFAPHEFLEHYVGDKEPAVWLPAENGDTSPNGLQQA